MNEENLSSIEEEKPKTMEDYAFVVGRDQTGVGEVTFTIGRVQLDRVLIYSGAWCNLIDYETWRN